MSLVILTIISGIIIFLGLAGTLLPFLPGPQLSLLGLIIYGWFTGFEYVSVLWIVIFAILTLLTMLFDIFGPALGAKKQQASRQGVWGSVLGGLFGIFVLGPIGVLAGPFIGGFIWEFYASQNHGQALRAAWGAFVAMLIGTMFKFAVSLGMTGYFILAIIKSI